MVKTKGITGPTKISDSSEADDSTGITGVNKVKDAPAQTTRDIEDLLDQLEDLKKVKEEFLAIFGLFAALLIFSSVEIKIFSDTTPFSLVLGISSFFVSSLMLFVLTLNNIVHSRKWRDYRSAAFLIAVVFFVFSMECFYFHTHHAHIWLFGSR